MNRWSRSSAVVGLALAAGLAGCASRIDVGDVLRPGDRTLIEATVQGSLENNRTGEPRTWTNEETGHSGSVTPLRTFQTSRGTSCRDYQQILTIENRAHTAVDTACRRPDGTWQSTEYDSPANVWSYIRLRDSSDPVYADRPYDYPYYGHGGYYGYYPGYFYGPRTSFGLSVWVGKFF